MDLECRDHVDTGGRPAQEPLLPREAPGHLERFLRGYRDDAVHQREVEVRRDGEKIATLGEGDVVGETGVVKRGLRNATVVATEPVRVIAFTQDQVKKMRKALPELDEQLHDLLEERSN